MDRDAERTNADPASEPVSTIYGTVRRSSKRRIDLTYDYEHAQIRACRRTADLIGATHLIDVGANIGVYSVYLADLPSIVEVDAFEPVPLAFEELSANIAIQPDPDRFRLHRLALSDGDGTAELAVYGDMAGNNAITDTDPGDGAGSTVSVRTARLDGVIEATGERFIAKIDVEGHELRVLAGASQYFARNVGVVQVECFPQNEAELVHAMAALGYERIYWMAFDHVFTNVLDEASRAAILHIGLAEMADALADLQTLRLLRRDAARRARGLLGAVRFDRDPTVV